MSRHTLYALLLCLVLAALGLWLIQNTEPKTQPEPLANDLRLDSAAQLVLRDHAGVIARLKKVDSIWMEQTTGFPANRELLSATLSTLTTARKVRAKTRQPGRYERLGVNSVDAEDARGVELVITDGSDRELLAMVFGDDTSRGQYARQISSDQAWLIAPKLALPIDNVEWLARDVLNVPAEQLQRIRLQHADGELVDLVKPAPDQPAFTIVSPDVAAPEQYAANRIAGLLSELRLESVKPSPAFAQDARLLTATFTLTNETIIGADAWKTDDAVWFSFSTVSLPPGIPDPTVHLQGWIVTLPTFKQAQFLSRADDLLK